MDKVSLRYRLAEDASMGTVRICYRLCHGDRSGNRRLSKQRPGLIRRHQVYPFFRTSTNEIADSVGDEDSETLYCFRNTRFSFIRSPVPNTPVVVSVICCPS